MESLIVNSLSPCDKIIVVVSGKFGERWSQMAKVFGLDVIEVQVPWGQSIDPEIIKESLLKHPDCQAVLCQACETSSAVAHPIQELGKIVANYPDCLLLVDGITALGAYPLPMDEFHIDGLVGGSQKAFMLPTGLAFVSFSQKAWKKIPTARCPRFYFDIRHEDKANKAGETYFSSSVAMIRALDFVITQILEQGLDKHFQSIRRRANFTRHFFPRLGFQLYAPHSPSDSVTALLVPAGMDGQKIRSHLEQKYKITIMGGQDQAKGKIIRLGHMGYIQDSELIKLFISIAKTLMDLYNETHTLTTQNFSTQEWAKLTAELHTWLENN
jgi:aspartate aminotransferase-like enzyme